jgi:hypothetical protein
MKNTVPHLFSFSPAGWRSCTAGWTCVGGVKSKFQWGKMISVICSFSGVKMITVIFNFSKGKMITVIRNFSGVK